MIEDTIESRSQFGEPSRLAKRQAEVRFIDDSGEEKLNQLTANVEKLTTLVAKLATSNNSNKEEVVCACCGNLGHFA
ncbi:hypothetical protein JJ728_23355 [Salmonella enterica subsp. enterica serovar Typhi]|nr:hypothetical protein [Salmonella enterica subsp. enterica serovar Typhi]